MNPYIYFKTYLPSWPTAEVSHKYNSMLSMPCSDTQQLDADVTPAAYNGLQLDEIQENARMIRAGRNEKIDIARSAVKAGQEQEAKLRANQSPKNQKK